MVLICHGPEIVLRCGTCGAEIKHVGYEPSQPWPAAKAMGWAIAKGIEKNQVGTIAAHSAWPTRMNRWTSSARIRRVAGKDRARDQDNPQKRGLRLGQNPTITPFARKIAVLC